MLSLFETLLDNEIHLADMQWEIVTIEIEFHLKEGDVLRNDKINSKYVWQFRNSDWSDISLRVKLADVRLCSRSILWELSGAIDANSVRTGRNNKHWSYERRISNVSDHKE